MPRLQESGSASMPSATDAMPGGVQPEQVQDKHARNEQAMASDGDTPRARLAGSRQALIALVDRLAHRSPLILAITALGAVVTALAAMIADGGWIGLAGGCFWLALLALPLRVTARDLRRYRSGIGYSGRPMRWRMRHTAGLAVISAALGTGALILAPTGPVGVHAIAWLCAILALGHLAHGPAALASALPGIALSAIALTGQISSGIVGEAALWALIFSVSGLVIAACWGTWQHRQLVRQALDDHPRRETPQITARRKKAPRAYNPYKLRPRVEKERPRPYLYRPETAGKS